MPNMLNPLEVMRVNAIMQGLQDARELPQELVFLNRTTVVNAMDAEILARFIGTILTADLIADDQAAPVYEMGKMQFETTIIPNLKLGVSMTQTQINQLLKIMGQQANPSDMSMFTDYQTNVAKFLDLGVKQRMESLIVGMWTDSYDYDRLGIKIIGGTWGMPSDLKITPSTAWTDAGNADGVSDIILAQRVAAVRYGDVYNRVTMSRAAFNLLTAQTSFINRARAFFNPGTASASFPIAGVAANRELANKVLSQESPMEIELYDSRFYTQSTTGVITATPYLPLNKVILSSTMNDNRPEVMDWGNGIVTETIVNSILRGGVVGSFAGGAYGPVSYVTGNPSLNPPNITTWGVGRGFPRKKRLSATAVLNIGTVTDPLSAAMPYPA